MDGVICGLDIGTTKVCALVGEVKDGQLRIIGLGNVVSTGLNKGMIVDVGEAAVAVAKAVEQAEQTSGYRLARAYISMAGAHIDSQNSLGSIGVHKKGGGVAPEDIERALATAQTLVSLQQDQEIVHLVPRNYRIDDTVVVSPIGMVGNRLEVDAHIVTGGKMALRNLGKCVDTVGIEVEEFVLNSLASGEAVLDPNERQMDVMVADIGGGTTDLALYTQGSIYHTKVLPIGGYHVTNDIAIGLRVPFDMAERVKLEYGDCRPGEIDAASEFRVKPFGGETIRVGRQDLAAVIEARIEEIFHFILEEIRESGYAGLLPAGIVLTGGGSLLRGVTTVAERVLGVPARVATPRNLVGLVDTLRSPSYATSVGLLRWATSDNILYRPQVAQNRWGRRFGNFFRAFLPG